MSDIEDAEVVETGIEKHGGRSIVTQDELSVDQVIEQVHKIQRVMQATMKDNEHYGVIPGTNKPTLLKPGAEKLCLTFRLAPSYDCHETWDGDHYTVRAICRLNHIATGNFIAAGEGLCSTKESKYAYRNASRKCPACGIEAIIKGKQEYGGGWVCFKKKNGCGAKFNDNDPAIIGQEQGRVANPDLPDSYNTVLKMACKRSLIAAVLNGTAASDIFTQDIGDSEVADWTKPESGGASNPTPKTEQATPTQEVGSTSSPQGTEVEPQSPGSARSHGGSPQAPVEEAAPSLAASSGTAKKKAKTAERGETASEPGVWGSTPKSPSKSASLGGDLRSLLVNAVASGEVKTFRVLSTAAKLCVTHNVMPPDGLGTIDDIPDAVLPDLVSELGLSQESMKV